MNLFQRKVVVVLNVNDGTESRTITIDGSVFHIGFSVIKSDSDSNNIGIIEIYNLSDNNRLGLNIKTIGNSSGSIYANYANGTSKELLYTGDICEIKDSVEGGDLLTMISLATGFNEKKKESKSISFIQGTNLRQVVDGILKQSPNLKINIESIDEDISFSRALSMSGNFITELETILKETGHKVINEDNELTIRKAGTTKSSITHIINRDTGMIGIPEQVTRETDPMVMTNSDTKSTPPTPETNGDVSTVKLKPTQVDVGYRVTTLLNTNIRLGDEIELSSKRLKIEKQKLRVGVIEHQGSNYDNDFYTIIEAYLEESIQ